MTGSANEHPNTFFCPSCGTMLGKALGPFLQTYCRHCKTIRSVNLDLLEIIRASRTVTPSGRPHW